MWDKLNRGERGGERREVTWNSNCCVLIDSFQFDFLMPFFGVTQIVLCDWMIFLRAANCNDRNIIEQQQQHHSLWNKSNRFVLEIFPKSQSILSSVLVCSCASHPFLFGRVSCSIFIYFLLHIHVGWLFLCITFF
jgi:hypothetical protein